MTQEKVLKKMKKSHVPRKKMHLWDAVWELLTKDIEPKKKQALHDFLTDNSQSMGDVLLVTRFTETSEYKNNHILRHLVKVKTEEAFAIATAKKDTLFPGTPEFIAIMKSSIDGSDLPKNVLRRLLHPHRRLSLSVRYGSLEKLKRLCLSSKIEDLYACSYEDLTYVVGIGPLAVRGIKDFFASKHIIWPNPYH